MIILGLVYVMLVFLLIKLALVFKGSRAISILFGVIFVLIISILANNTPKLFWLNKIFKNIEPYVFFLLFFIFLEEIRKFFAEIGRYPLMLFSLNSKNNIVKKMNECDILANVVFTLSKEKLGSLIIVEQNIPLDSYKETGSIINANLNYQLLYSIFTHSSSLHDGAVILNLEQKKIIAAGCVLPLSKNQQLDKKLGTRHRAALGMSEVTDSYIILTSEESGEVRIFHKGRMINISNKENLKQFFENKKNGLWSFILSKFSR